MIKEVRQSIPSCRCSSPCIIILCLIFFMRAMRNVAEETFTKLAAACEGECKTGLVQS